MSGRYVGMGEERITLKTVFGPYRKGKYWTKDIVDAIEKNDYLEGKVVYCKQDSFGRVIGPGTGRVLVDYTETSFGGYRLWLVCELCRQKRTYLIGNNDTIRCRECLGMQYVSQYGNSLEKTFIKAQNLSENFCKLVDSSSGYYTYAGKPTKRALKIRKAFEMANVAKEGFQGEISRRNSDD